MKPRLTERQNQAYEFIRAYLREHRKPPTLQELGRELSIRSTNGVFKLLRALEGKGYIRRQEHTARGLQLVDPDDDPLAGDGTVPSLPIVNRASSERPDLLRRRPRGSLYVDPSLLRGTDEEHCLVGRAGDDGMNGDGIRKGDFLIVEERPWQELENGALAAFLVREELIARRFLFANNRLHLRPADRTYTEETFSPGDPQCHVIGRIVVVMRKLASPSSPP